MCQPWPALPFGATLALIVAVRYFGLFNGGRAAPEVSKAAAPVAAVIVDPSALNRATAAIEALNMTMIEANHIDKEKNRIFDALATEVDRLREEMLIQREIGRRHRS